MAVFPVILCGGSGTRLWPTSRADRPKQFVSIVPGQASLFTQTLERVASVPGVERTLIVTGARMADGALAQLGDFDGDILLEPEGRDSAAAMAAAAVHARNLDPDAVCVFVASDHHIPDVERFRALISQAVEAAREGQIVLFGIRPSHAETAYGYIRPTDSAAPISAVHSFTEKPDATRAEEFVRDGYLWNSGNFISGADTLLEEIDRFAPDVGKAARDAVRDGTRDGRVLRLGEVFRQAPKVSIDYAVMEPTDRAAVITADLEWSDLGAWDSVARLLPADDAGNRAQGPAIFSESRDCYIRATPSLPVAVHGISGLAIVAEADGILVCPLEHAQAVKQLGTEAEKRRLAEPGPSLSDWAMRYHHWLFQTALPTWWTYGTDHAGWGFHEELARNLTATDADRRLRVQARQTWCFARAGTLGWPGPWQSAVIRGFEAIEQVYRRPDGLYRTLAKADGSPADETAKLYDQAFVILALAAACDTIEDAETRALALLDAVENAMRHDAGGFREAGSQPYQANAHMHLFEASLGWIEAGSSPRWRALAEEIAALALRAFIDMEQGTLREFYDAEWRPASGDDGMVMEPGHLFEWGWLLLRWHRLGGGDEIARAADAIISTANASIDAARNVAVNATDLSGTAMDAGARLWPQTERLKALLIKGETEAAVLATASLWRYLDVPEAGLWHDMLDTDGRFDTGSVTASSFYHIIGAVEGLMEAQ